MKSFMYTQCSTFLQMNVIPASYLTLMLDVRYCNEFLQRREVSSFVVYENEKGERAGSQRVGKKILIDAHETSLLFTSRKLESTSRPFKRSCSQKAASGQFTAALLKSYRVNVSRIIYIIILVIMRFHVRKTFLLLTRMGKIDIQSVPKTM